MTFTTEEPPADIDTLVAQIESLPGTAKAEQIPHDHFDDLGEDGTSDPDIPAEDQ